MHGNFYYYERHIEEVVFDIVEKTIEAGYGHNLHSHFFEKINSKKYKF